MGTVGFCTPAGGVPVAPAGAEPPTRGTTGPVRAGGCTDATGAPPEFAACGCGSKVRFAPAAGCTSGGVFPGAYIPWGDEGRGAGATPGAPPADPGPGVVLAPGAAGAGPAAGAVGWLVNGRGVRAAPHRAQLAVPPWFGAPQAGHVTAIEYTSRAEACVK